MAVDFMIDDRELARYIAQTGFIDKKIATRASRVLRLLTSYTERQMKRYSRSRNPRATGNLSSSITAKYTLTNTYVESEVYVPSHIKYQFVAEYGIKRNSVISGKPIMTFPVASWKKASANVKVPHRGYFVFTQVQRGTFAGKFFTKKAFEDLNSYYKSKIENYLINEVQMSITGI